MAIAIVNGSERPVGFLDASVRSAAACSNGNIGRLFAVAVSPDGKLAAVSRWTGTRDSGLNIYIFDIPLRARRRIRGGGERGTVGQGGPGAPRDGVGGDLTHDVLNRVKDLTGGRQHPNKLVGDSIRDFPIAVVL